MNHAGATRTAIGVMLGLMLVASPSGMVGTPVVAAGCPSAPVTIAKLVKLGTPRCYGTRILTFRAFVPELGEGLGGTSAYQLAPSWLNDLDGSWVMLSAGPNAAGLVAFVPPALGRCFGPRGATCAFRSYRDGWAIVSAHYDGPVAQTCRYESFPPDPKYADDFTTENAVAECREKLIVLSVGPDVPLPATDAPPAPGGGGSALGVTLLFFASFAVAATRFGGVGRCR